MMLSTSESVRAVVALKAKMMFRGGQLQGVITGIGLLIGFAFAGAVAWFVAVNDEPDGITLSMVLLASITISWFVGAITFGGGEQVLDPSRFVLFPMSMRSLCFSFYCAAFVGVLAPATTMIALATLRYANSILSGVVMFVAAMVTVMTGVVSGRVGVGLLAGLSRGRRTKELAAALAATVAAGSGILAQFVIPALDLLTEDVRASMRSVLRWLPWGWAPEALARSAEGASLVSSLLLLVGSIGFLAVLFAVWVRLIDRALQSKEANKEVGGHGELLLAWMSSLPRTPTVAVAARTFRQLRRDPRELMQLATVLPLAIVIGLPSWEGIQAGEPNTVLGSGALGLFAGLTLQGVFASDGRSFGVDALALGDLTPVITGKALARVALSVPFILLVGMVVSALTNGWSRLFAGLSIGIVTLCASAAVGVNTSVRHAQPLPEKIGAFNQNANQGCAAGIASLVSLASGFLIALVATLPIVLATIFVSPILGAVCSVFGVAYGVIVFRVGVKRAALYANSHVPEMYQQLSVHG